MMKKFLTVLCVVLMDFVCRGLHAGKQRSAAGRQCCCRQP